MRAHSGVDATGMRRRVEVVGDKYDMDIGGFGVFPCVPAPAKLEGGMAADQAHAGLGYAAVGAHET